MDVLCVRYMDVLKTIATQEYSQSSSSTVFKSLLLDIGLCLEIRVFGLIYYMSQTGPSGVYVKFSFSMQ